MKLFEAVKSGIIAVMAAAGFTMSLSSCDASLFDYEGDCEVTYSLNFVYDMNLKWADAFASEVKSVNVYVFDDKGLYVKEFSESGDVLSVPEYVMPLDLVPGKYTLVGWCGLVNEGAVEESFSVKPPVAGVTTIDELTCALNTRHDPEKGLYTDTELRFMFHGKIDVELPDSRDGQHYLYTMPLTKDTNHIRIMIQHVSNDLYEKDFNLSIQAANGVLAYDNSPVGGQPVTYYAWYMGSDLLGMGDDAGTMSVAEGDPNEYYGVIADLSTCRMMASQQDAFYLSAVFTEDGKAREIFRIPVIQYALLTKKYCEQAYGHPMTDQDYLDRQDEYSMTFFIGEDMKWIYAIVEVLTWRVVVRNYNV